jgi:arsenate reductase (thioredoxin)
MKRRVLFLCTHNSARSQLAEGLLRKWAGDQFEVFSAGTEATRVHPLAIQAMRELGIDISEQRSKTLDEYVGQDFDYVITVCDKANEMCPIFPSDPERIHWSFEDPSQAKGTEERQRPTIRWKSRTADGLGHRLIFDCDASFVERCLNAPRDAPTKTLAAEVLDRTRWRGGDKNARGERVWLVRLT